MKEKRKKEYKLKVSCVILLLANLLFFLTIWLSNKYDNISLDQVLYQIKTSTAGADRSLSNSIVIRVVLFGILATALEVGLYLLLSGKLKEKFSKSTRYLSYCTGKVCRFFLKRVLPISLSLFLVSAAAFVVRLDVVAYVGNILTESDFIETHYADPNEVEMTFPEEKRNLIYIFLESMEVTYTDPTVCETIVENYIPELTQLANENINFSHDSDLGGALSYNGTTWTAAAMVAQTCGVPIKVSLISDDYGGESYYLPGIVTLGDILEEQGYQQVLLLGSDAKFADKETYFVEHGNYDIVDIKALKDSGRLEEDYLEWWGYEDEKLFAYAKEELTRLSESGDPFHFSMLTADTHFPDGYVCNDCEQTHEEQYANVLSCSSKRVYDFIEWIKEQPFYEDTTIVLCGDHLTMDPKFLEDIDEDYTRTVYNCIINAAVSPVQEKNRLFGTFDMLPTTLAAMGVQIEGERLGLGTNLFSAEQTLTEQYGYEVLNDELQKRSPFYNKKFFNEE